MLPGITHHLPESGGPLDQVRQLIAITHEYSILLILGVFAGLAVANLDHQLYEELVDYHLFGDQAKLFGRTITAHFLTNEIFMVFFFGIAAKEITVSLLPGGALNPVNKAVNPLLGTIGGVLGPAGLYLLLAFIFFGRGDDFAVVANGWAIPTATDIALAWLVARLVFGRGHPAVNFLLLLAVADDGIGLGIIAIFYPDPERPVMPVWLLLAAAGMGASFGLRRMGVQSWLPYIAIGGILSWVGLIKASIEPALALVPIVPFLPSSVAVIKGLTKPELGDEGLQAGMAANHHATGGRGPLDQFEHHLKGLVDVGLFFFAFANAGVPFGSINSVTFIVLTSLIVGKIVGISLFSWAGVKAGFPLPTGMDTRHLVLAGLIAGLGLTVALFVAGKAFPGPPYLDPAKMGAVLSGGVAVLAVAAGYILKIKGAGARNRGR
ncbi:MAG: Na+/H+ antiporter NhaA [Chloroflexi bacterium]|nr:Na+/H+ antiporter NhaA [Chloroflexota bacterium]